MSTLNEPIQFQNIVQEIDRLIADMTALRNQVATLSSPLAQTDGSVRKAEYFGMWADREDMNGQSSQ